MRILTVGHSNQLPHELIALLQHAGVRRVIDVRSWPRSKRVPHFDREPLTATLSAAGIEYRWLGKLLGGLMKKIDGETTDEYWKRLRGLERFQRGLDLLLEPFVADAVLLCAERDPLHCHRFWAIAEELTARDVEVEHLLAGGEIVSHRRLAAQTKAAQLSLF